jgi:hypothetical protein
MGARARRLATEPYAGEASFVARAEQYRMLSLILMIVAFVALAVFTLLVSLWGGACWPAQQRVFAT